MLMFSWWIRLDVVVVADKYRITVTRSVREVVPLRVRAEGGCRSVWGQDHCSAFAR